MTRQNNEQMSSDTQATPSGTTYQHRNESVFVPTGYVAVGRITAPHSLQGEVRVELHTDFPERFGPEMAIFVGPTLVPMTVTSARPHKQMVLLKLAEVTNRNDAETLRGQWLFVHEDDAVELDEDTYWVHDIIGMTVHTDTEEVLGVISDVLFTGANDVYIIQGTDSEGNKRELLLPAIADVVKAVDPEGQRMTVHLLPGLI